MSRIGSLLLLAGVACGRSSSTPAPADSTPNAVASAPESVPAPEAADVQGEIHDVKCGCALSEVGQCGEFVEVDGAYVPLELPSDAGLGPMPFCGKDDLQARVQGDVHEGRFVATSFELTTPATAPQ